MKIGVPREIHAGERRVATTPDVASQLIKLGFSVAVESGRCRASFQTRPTKRPAAKSSRQRAIWEQSDSS